MVDQPQQALLLVVLQNLGLLILTIGAFWAGVLVANQEQRSSSLHHRPDPHAEIHARKSAILTHAG